MHLHWLLTCFHSSHFSLKLSEVVQPELKCKKKKLWSVDKSAWMVKVFTCSIEKPHQNAGVLGMSCGNYWYTTKHKRKREKHQQCTKRKAFVCIQLIYSGEDSLLFFCTKLPNWNAAEVLTQGHLQWYTMVGPLVDPTFVALTQFRILKAQNFEVTHFRILKVPITEFSRYPSEFSRYPSEFSWYPSEFSWYQ